MLCNGDRLVASQWIHAGDQIAIGETLITLQGRQGEIALQVEERPSTVASTPTLTPPPRPVESTVSGEEVVMIAPVEFTPRSAGSGRARRPLRPAQIAMWATIAALALIVWFTFTARTVEIRIDPQPDTVSIVGTWLKLEIGGNYRIRPGSYVVIAEKDGFRRLEVPLEVSSDAHQIVELQLEPEPGRLSIVTRPEQGVRVSIDGRPVGSTPLESIALPPGEHLVEVSAERHRSDRAVVTIEGPRSTALLEFFLVPLWAPVTLDSVPQGAEVRIDGRSIGRTPVIAEVLEGGRDVEIRLTGYKPYRMRLAVTAGQPLAPDSPRLQPVEGWLIVKTAPQGATINIDSTYRGVSPLELELTPGREHVVTASMRGHQTHEERVQIDSGKTHEIELHLEAEYGELEVVVAPADAELLVDGAVAEGGSQTLRLPAVPHRIDVRKAGFVAVSREVTPRPGFPQRIEIELQSEEEAQEAARASVVRTSQGQELRLIGPGRFRMGASRREPGRRANETLRDVELTRHFYLATEEVSNAEFNEFRQHRAGQIGGSSLDLDDYPVTEVTWEDAARYCNWLSAKESLPAAYVEQAGTLVAAVPMTKGYRLPTEAEWVWAARYEGGGPGKKYPWGDSLPIPSGSGNYADGSARSILPEVIAGHQDGYPATAPVDSYEPNALGIWNLGGNVAEWVHDPYSIYSSAATGVDRDPMGPVDGGYHVIKGAGWTDAKITELRLSYRDYGDDGRPDVGFRIARYAD